METTMAMDAEHDRLFNVHWWAAALIDHRKREIAEHSGERAHQKIDPDSHEPHGPDHTLTAWERAWIRERVIDTLVDRLKARTEHAPILDESAEDHEARELLARSRDYFGDTHDETRRKFQELRAEHVQKRDAIHSRRGDLAVHKRPVEHAHLGELIEQHEQVISQVDTHLDLVERHIATVKADVAEKRRAAQKHLTEATKVLEVPLDDIVAEYIERVQGEVRSAVASEAASAK